MFSTDRISLLLGVGAIVVTLGVGTCSTNARIDDVSRCTPSSSGPSRLPYEVVLNVGCAEGYYAVGLARRMPAVVCRRST